VVAFPRGYVNPVSSSDGTGRSRAAGVGAMPFDVRVFPVLVAGPSDVEDELAEVVDAIQTWNRLHSSAMGLIMDPRNWRTHSAPELGADAQTVLNAQLGDECDAVVAVFGVRMGTPTPRAISGTAEELDRFHRAGKRVMAYFSAGPMPRENFSMEQFQELEKFRRSLRERGLLGEYSSKEDLRRKLDAHLAELGYRFKSSLGSADDPRPRLSPVGTESEGVPGITLAALDAFRDSLRQDREAREERLTGEAAVKASYAKWAHEIGGPTLQDLARALEESGEFVQYAEPKGPNPKFGLEAVRQGSGTPSFRYFLSLHEKTGSERAFVVRHTIEPNDLYPREGEKRIKHVDAAFFNEHGDGRRNHAPEITASDIVADFRRAYEEHHGRSWPPAVKRSR
jgi:hypothetical protein